METYYTDEYQAIKTYGGKTMAMYEQANNVQEDNSGRDITEFFDEFKLDVMVGHDQIQQTSGPSKKHQMR
jgi:hypothetical protein